MDIESELRATADEFPRFMYPDNQEYDAGDEEAGLFKGRLLFNVSSLTRGLIVDLTYQCDVFKVMKHIYTGPSSVSKPPSHRKVSRANNAKISGMSKTTPESVAYAACQVSRLEATEPRRADTDTYTMLLNRPVSPNTNTPSGRTHQGAASCHTCENSGCGD